MSRIDTRESMFPEDGLTSEEKQRLKERFAQRNRSRRKNAPFASKDTTTPPPGLSKKVLRNLDRVRMFGWNVSTTKGIGESRLNAPTNEAAQNMDHFPVTSDFQRWRRKLKRWIERRREGR